MTKARDIANIGTALTTVSATELGYLDGTTSAIQTQINAKQPTVANVSDTEIGYLDGVTSAIQTQLDSKATTANIVSTAGGSTITVASGTTVPLTIQNDGTGNSFVVNDVASDTTPFVVNNAGKVLVNNTTSNGPSIEVINNNGTNGTIVGRGASATDGVFVQAQANTFYSTPTYTMTGIGQMGASATGTTAGITNAGLGSLTFQNNSNALIYTNSSAPIIFGTEASEKVRITNTGNVGIGTTSPAAKLDVNGDARFNNQQYAGKNKIINGNFDVFQRTSFTSQTVAGYTLDRWYAGLGGTVTVSQQTTGAPVGSRYCARVAYGSAGSYSNMFQALEAGTVKALAGQTVTASVLVRANATWAAISGQSLNLLISKNSTADTLSGGSWGQIGSATISAASIPTGTGSADWYKLSVTVAIPNDGTAAGLRFQMAESAVGPSGAYWEMAQAQIEIGSAATAFTTSTGTIQGELAACQRYYYRHTQTVAYERFAFGMAASTNIVAAVYPLKVTMRANPTSIDSSGLSAYDQVTQSSTAASVTLVIASAQQPEFTIGSVGGALTQFRPYEVIAAGTSGSYIGFSAEL